MATNESFQLVKERGWQRGLRIFNAELGGWWKTSSWWVQSLIWIGVINIAIGSVLWGRIRSCPCCHLPLCSLFLPLSYHCHHHHFAGCYHR